MTTVNRPWSILNPMSRSLHTPVGNRILSALPLPSYRRLLPDLEAVLLSVGEVLYEPGATIRHVYFPNQGIVSLLTTVEDRTSLEVAMAGPEAMLGLPALLGVATSRYQAVVRGAGTALRIKAKLLLQYRGEANPLHLLLNQYTHALLTQIAQVALCNRFHPLNARLARWLLMTHDRMPSAEFEITQALISQLLGVRRSGITVAAGRFQKQALIRYRHGTIAILDRRGLEAAACACYRIIKGEDNRALGA
jgi:CRP-like cAMP-binding protein